MSDIRFHLDEDCQAGALASALRQHGIDVVTTNQAGIAGADDERQLREAARNGRVLQITFVISSRFTRAGSREDALLMRALSFSRSRNSRLEKSSAGWRV